jgi:hypothetical protein
MLRRNRSRKVNEGQHCAPKAAPNAISVSLAGLRMTVWYENRIQV